MSARATTFGSVSAKSGLKSFLPERVTASGAIPALVDLPLISVIIPCYNAAAYLEDALLSALAQSYSAVEIVVVDDGSTDGSGEIAQRFPVRYIYQQNRGKSEARNRGIQEARGAYIVFLDADDRLKREALESGLRALEIHPDCVFAVGDHVFISADGSYLSRSHKVANLRSPYTALLKSNFIEMISTVLFRRRIFAEVGGFDENLHVAEDYDLYLRITRLQPICCHTSVVAEYRKHEGNISRQSELMLTTTVQVLEGQVNYLGNDSDRRRAFRMGLRSWRKRYGRQLASELATSFPTLSAEQRRRKLRLLVDHYPQGLLIFLMLRFVPKLRQHRPAPYFRRRFAEEAKNCFDQQPLVGNLVVAQLEVQRTKVAASIPSGLLR